MSQKYELTIYTAGTRYYALKVAHAVCRYMVGAPDVDVFTECDMSELEKKAVDLNRELFGNRIISRSDTGDLGKDVKSLKRVFPDGGKMSVMVDDREDVWANAKDNDSLMRGREGEPPLNLLYIRPYHFEEVRLRGGGGEVKRDKGTDWEELLGKNNTQTAKKNN